MEGVLLVQNKSKLCLLTLGSDTDLYEHEQAT